MTEKSFTHQGRTIVYSGPHESKIGYRGIGGALPSLDPRSGATALPALLSDACTHHLETALAGRRAALSEADKEERRRKARGNAQLEAEDRKAREIRR